MKKNTFAILATILVFISIDTTAQIRKGEKMIGTSLSFTSHKIAVDDSDEDSKLTSIMIAPQVGFGFGKGERDGLSPFDVDITTYSGIIHPGFYFRPGNKLVIEAAFGRIGYTSLKRDYSANFNDSKESSFEFSVTDGLSLGFKIIL